jgi:hypothetical protein
LSDPGFLKPLYRYNLVIPAALERIIGNRVPAMLVWNHFRETGEGIGINILISSCLCKQQKNPITGKNFIFFLRVIVKSFFQNKRIEIY